MIGDETEERDGSRVRQSRVGPMFFLLRVAFWLSVAILFIPADPQYAADRNDGRDVSTFEAIGAAQSAYQDVKGFCGRNPGACDVGRVALDTFTAKARTGARWVSRQLDGNDRGADAPTTTGSTGRAAPIPGLRPTVGWDAPLPPKAPVG
jgi:hypothetical protein